MSEVPLWNSLMTVIFILVNSVSAFSSADLLSASYQFRCTVSPSIHFHPWSSQGCPQEYIVLLFFFLTLGYTTLHDCKTWGPRWDHWLIFWLCKDAFKLLTSTLKWLNRFLFQRLINKLIWIKSYLPPSPHTYFSQD